MMKWFSEHWDKVLTIIFSGVVGFFAAIFTIQGRVADLQKDLAKAQATLDTSVVPKLQTLEELARKSATFERDLADFQKQNSLSVQTNSYLQLLVTEERKRTLSELREIIKEQQPSPKP
jgi:hypothetical protein